MRLSLYRINEDWMKVQDLLIKNKKPILERWFDLILETYPPDSATLMRRDRDPFTNPVGSTISREIEILFEKLCLGRLDEKCMSSLDSILKIRSVQTFSPSQAVGFIFLLKRAIGEILREEMDRESLMKEWLEFQFRIDGLALRAFDVYMSCREKICEIRVSQARAEKERALRMMERMMTSETKRLNEGDESP